MQFKMLSSENCMLLKLLLHLQSTLAVLIEEGLNPTSSIFRDWEGNTKVKGHKEELREILPVFLEGILNQKQSV